MTSHHIICTVKNHLDLEILRKILFSQSETRIAISGRIKIKWCICAYTIICSKLETIWIFREYDCQSFSSFKYQNFPWRNVSCGIKTTYGISVKDLAKIIWTKNIFLIKKNRAFSMVAMFLSDSQESMNFCGGPTYTWVVAWWTIFMFQPNDGGS